MIDLRDLLLEKLTLPQQEAVKSALRRTLVVAGAGSGKTEVMGRRVAWWVGVEDVPKNSIVAFTFTEAAAEELKFRIRRQIQTVTPPGNDVTLGGMYVGTIHGFCLKTLRELSPDDYHNYDVIDEAARLALVQRGYFRVLGLSHLKSVLGIGQFATIDQFLFAYDLLNEYDALDVELLSQTPPHALEDEAEWCKGAVLRTDLGNSPVAQAFALAAARYYAYLRCRHFLDFSTSQSELLRLFKRTPAKLHTLREKVTHLVVDEVQDINPVQDRIVRKIVGRTGHLTAVGDHRQAIFGWRGGRVDIMAALFEELRAEDTDSVIELTENFRSTPRIIDVANRWAGTIGTVRSMSNPQMAHGRKKRLDLDSTHGASLTFAQREDEAKWIARQIRSLVAQDGKGAVHDTDDDKRGITYSDVTVLLRSSTDARTYMRVLEQENIPAVFRAGPDLFSQPEILLFVSVLARMAGLTEFVGADYDARSFPNRVKRGLGCTAQPEPVIRAACGAIRSAGLHLDPDVEDRLLLATTLIHRKIAGMPAASGAELRKLRTPKLVEWLRRGGELRRVFPQTLFHYALSEAGVAEWESTPIRGASAMFHLGQLSSLVKRMETPGWTTAGEFQYQVIALYLWGTKNAKVEEAPLLVQPDAVTVSTVHGAKGLEYAAVFIADVCPRRFPSQFAKSIPKVPFDGPILAHVDPSQLADNDNLDGERRLMYVALTRAERYLFVTGTGRSTFLQTIQAQVRLSGGTVEDPSNYSLEGLSHLKSEFRRDFRLATSFSDLRYFLECPHDFYLRKVLGFAPTIDQAFGYGRGVHNLLRAVHSDPATWARLAADPSLLKQKLETLIARGLFYLRYTTGDPAENMRRRAMHIVADYVATYADELSRLQFEPEREFETLIPEEQVLVSGAIDVVRLEDPPRVTLIDFKSGEAESGTASKLDAKEMALQISLYGLAARHELEYEPERGLVRYLGEANSAARELAIELDDTAITAARQIIVDTARAIRQRGFQVGPRTKPHDQKLRVRCAECDFGQFCGMKEAKQHRGSTVSG